LLGGGQKKVKVSLKKLLFRARSQSARTYLEKHFDEYANSTDQNVITRHALLALKETLQTNTKLDENVFLICNKNIFFLFSLLEYCNCNCG